MDNSKLLSNEPLKVLTQHITHLRQLYSQERAKNKKLSTSLKSLKASALPNYSFEAKHLPSSTLCAHSTRSHNKGSFDLNSSSLSASLILKDLNDEYDIRVSMAGVFKLNDFLRKTLRMAFKIIIGERMNQNRLMRIAAIVAVEKLIWRRLNGCIRQLIMSVKVSGICEILKFGSIILRVLRKRWLEEFKAINKAGRITKGIRRDFPKDLKRLNEGARRIFQIFEKAMLARDREIIRRMVGNTELMIEIEQGVKILDELYIHRLEKRIGWGFIQLKKKYSRIFKEGLRSICWIFQKNYSYWERRSVCTSFYCIWKMVNEEKFKLVVENRQNNNLRLLRLGFRSLEKLELRIKKQCFANLLIMQSSIFLNGQPNLIVLNAKHHILSEKLILISKLPSKIHESLLKSTFLQIVAYVSHNISYTSLLFDHIQKLQQIHQLYQIKKQHKFLYIWKCSKPLKKLHSKIFLFETLSSLASKKISKAFKSLTSSPQVLRRSIINLNLIINRHHQSQKSITFNLWLSQLPLTPDTSSKENALPLFKLLTASLPTAIPVPNAPLSRLNFN